MIAPNYTPPDPEAAGEADPVLAAMYDLRWHALAESSSAGLSRATAAQLLAHVSEDLRRGQLPEAGSDVCATFKRKLRGHALRALGPALSLDGAGLALAAELAAECLEGEGSPEEVALPPRRAAACVRACDGIPTELLESGVVALLWQAACDADVLLAAEVAREVTRAG